jgi:hypothetical protein
LITRYSAITMSVNGFSLIFRFTENSRVHEMKNRVTI